MIIFIICSFCTKYTHNNNNNNKKNCFQNKEYKASVDTSKPELLTRNDPRLESFVIYLLINLDHTNMGLVELAVLEQLSFVKLEHNAKETINSFRFRYTKLI